ncbi:PREDICTED: 21 kDa protein-like [Nicotiana attenuata]|uniref:21 kDa protein n=1 Tax=Nicotiana attenuata TaxID=49451 RepID=A0A314L0M7_NICAT|nr:PREDICTED: 21 kDa protein-like [Nicotiana attenuata]OIT35208.1 21 kda protein [Nicotiana attenuata]
MSLSKTLLLALFLLYLSHFTTGKKPNKSSSSTDLVRTSCMHASYPTICVRTLSSYSGSAINTPQDLAQAAVKVSLSRAQKASDFLSELKVQSKREKGALSDCVEQMGDTMDELSKTLSELKHLSKGNAFKWQMSNLETWVSAALTNEDTCIDGFKEIDGKLRSDVKRKIINVARVTSNALYLINRLDDPRNKIATHP